MEDGVRWMLMKTMDVVCSDASTSTVDNACSSSRRVCFGNPSQLLLLCRTGWRSRIWVVMGLDLGLKIRGMAPWSVDGKSTDTHNGPVALAAPLPMSPSPIQDQAVGR